MIVKKPACNLYHLYYTFVQDWQLNSCQKRKPRWYMAKTVHQVMLIFTKTVIEDGKVLAQVEVNSMLKKCIMSL